MRYFMKIRMQSLMVALALAAMISGLVVQPQAFAQERLRNSVVEQIEVPNNPTIGQGSRDDSAAYRAEVEKRSALLQLRPASVDEDLMLSPPANDNFASATLLPPGVTTGTVPGTNVEATAETGEPNHAGASAPIQSVWYSWTSPANLSMTFETAAGTLVDTTLAVYTGSSVSGLTLVAANDEIGLNAGIGTPSRVTFIANSGVTYRIAVDGFSNNVGTFTLRYSINRAETFKQFNYDGDSTSDFAVFRPGNTTWYVIQSSTPTPLVRTFGLASDELVAGDYDGDGKTDITVWRPSNGTFYLIKSSTMTLLAMPWGSSGDRPVHGDFDGDDISDFAVWRPSNGVFYVRQSSDLSLFAVRWGVGTTDVPATGDYDGDGETDLGVFRWNGPEAGTFYVRRSSDESLLAERWGVGTDVIVPGDYDGDGKNDMAVYRQSNNTFYARRSFDGSLFALAWGQPGDLMAPGDYAGNFNTDVTIFRPSDGRFYVHTSGTGALLVMPWGQSGDVPVANKTVH